MATVANSLVITPQPSGKIIVLFFFSYNDLIERGDFSSARSPLRTAFNRAVRVLGSF